MSVDTPRRWSDFDVANTIGANDYFLTGNSLTGNNSRVNGDTIKTYIQQTQTASNVYFTFSANVTLLDSMNGMVGICLGNTASVGNVVVTINGNVRDGFRCRLIQLGANVTFSVASANLVVNTLVANSSTLAVADVLRASNNLIVTF